MINMEQIVHVCPRVENGHYNQSIPLSKFFGTAGFQYRIRKLMGSVCTLKSVNNFLKRKVSFVIFLE